MDSHGPVLVTGVSGFVGSAVARALQGAGYTVRALVRTQSPRTNLAGLGDVEVVEGDLRDAASLARACAGMRYLVHVAADYRLWVPDPSQMIAINVAGTQHLMRAALRAGIERIVHTSSVATLRVAHDTIAATEADALGESEAIGPYKQSKVAAERLVERMVAQDDLPAVIVNPSTPIGAGDVRPTPTGRIIVQAALGKIPAFVDTGLNLVGVDDVAQGHVAALERGRVGERYILGGQNVTLRQFLEEIAVSVGRRGPRLELPRGPLYPLAVLAETFGRASGKEPFLTRDALKMSRNRMYFSSAKAERELGYVARPYPFALAEALDWFRNAGYLGGSSG